MSFVNCKLGDHELCLYTAERALAGKGPLAFSPVPKYLELSYIFLDPIASLDLGYERDVIKPRSCKRREIFEIGKVTKFGGVWRPF